jgi:hypothetical protein
MANNPTIKARPKISVEAAGGATTTLGGVLMNLFVFHAVHFRVEQRYAALDRAVKAALDAVDVTTIKSGKDEHIRETKMLVTSIIKQAETIAREQLARRPEEIEPKIN